VQGDLAAAARGGAGTSRRLPAALAEIFPEAPVKQTGI
jgi:hypothetical protein